jgi:hypothetical protein
MGGYTKKQRREYYLKNREKALAQVKQWTTDNREKYNEYHRQYLQNEDAKLKHKIRLITYRDKNQNKLQNKYIVQREHKVMGSKEYWLQNKQKYAINRVAYQYKNELYVTIYYTEHDSGITYEEKVKGMHNAMARIIDFMEMGVRVLFVGTKKHGTLFTEVELNNIYFQLCKCGDMKYNKKIINHFISPTLKGFATRILKQKDNTTMEHNTKELP